MGCLSCGRGLHEECRNADADACCCPKTPTGAIGDLVVQRINRGRPHKDDTQLDDPHSTWRKRATLAFPLDREAACEWKGKADVGGGKYPIVGCANGLQGAIHHGPVKIGEYEFNFNARDDMDPGVRCNVHRVCRRCHALWHHWNDAPYSPESYAKLPHMPREASPKELLEWATAKTRPQAPEPRTTGPIAEGED